MPRVEITREQGSRPTIASWRSWSLGEIVPLPWWLLVMTSVVRYVARHWIVALSIVALFALEHVAGSWTALGLFALTVTCAAVLVLAGLTVAGASPLPWLRRILTGLSRRKQTRRGWPGACHALRLVGRGSERPVPRGRVRSITTGVRFAVMPGAVGLTAEDVRSKSYGIAANFHALSCVVRELQPSTAEVSLHWEDPLNRIIRLTDLPSPIDDFTDLGLTGDGTPAFIRDDVSTCVGGLSGSGKSSLIHTFLGRQLQRGTNHRIRIIDPAGGVELSAYDPRRGGRAYEYTDSPDDAGEVINHMRQGMERRLSWMRDNGIKKITRYTPDNPLDILIIDEFLLLDIPTGATSDLGRILAVGRKAGYIVLALSQLGQVDAWGRVRDLFPQRICGATNGQPLTDAVLGTGATAAGARCHKIGNSNRDRGRFYMWTDDTRSYVLFRGALVTDPEADAFARGIVPGHLVEV